MKAFISWSGGKDACLACYKATRNQGIEIKYLLNMACEDSSHSRSHGLNSSLLKVQAQAMGIPLAQGKASWQNYEMEFKKTVLDLKSQGVTTGVFGDIDVQEHRDWVEKTCKETDIKPILPLWMADRQNLLNEFITAGFKAIVVATVSNLLGKEWLGRQISHQFIEDLKTKGNIDLCGEKGEYHTFVYDGPIFKKPVEFIIGEKRLRNERWFLELK